MGSTLYTKEGKMLSIKEQTILNDASGLTIEFKVNDSDPSHPYSLIIFGECLKFGNREINFGVDGIKNGSGTACTPPIS